MVSRRHIVHALLALLLLLTQQLGVTHVYSHWGDLEPQGGQSAVRLTDEEQAEHRKRLAVHKVCAECMTVAQMGAAITSTSLALALATVGSGAVALPDTLPACERTTCVFLSRAPPLA